MDAEGPDVEWPVENGKVLKVNYLGKNIENYDSMLAVSYTHLDVYKRQGVKGYVGSGAIAAVAPKASAPETRYATAAEAQAAADKRETAYAAAVAAFQKQIDAQNAAYLAALGK